MPKPGDTVGRYLLETRLGAGGMGEVYRAFDQQLRRPVALKVLLAKAGAEDRSLGEWTARMVREARAAAAFNHPNAVAVYDVGEHEGLPFIVMELVVGTTVRSHLRDASVPVAQRVRWLVDVARALDAAHRAGLVHRDVKPDNVMVRGDGVVKILDFGIARQSAASVDPSVPTGAGGLETLTATGATMGTPAYMAPEQLKNLPLDGRTDQFAWGVMAYQVLSGRLPWEASQLLVLASSILLDDPPPLRSVCPELPEGVEATVARAMAKRPEDRFPSMAEAGQALEDAAAGRMSGPAQALLPAQASTGSSRAVTGPASSRDIDAMRTGRRSLRAVAITVAVAAGGVAAWLLVGAKGASRTPAAPASSVAPAVSSAAPTASAHDPAAAASADLGPPLRHPCLAPDAGKPCFDHSVAWCDAEERRIACCAKGLAAVGREGICGCPPGGSTDEPGAPADCPKRKVETSAIQAKVRAHFDALRKCYEGALAKAPKMKGRVAVHFELTPEGRVIDARVDSASLPDPDAQVCMLETFREIRFDPPPNGTLTITYPIAFSPDPDP